MFNEDCENAQRTEYWENTNLALTLAQILTFNLLIDMFWILYSVA